MEEIFKIKRLYELKEVERKGEINGRHETSAEHTYSCLILAKYFLDKIKQPIDHLKVMNMLLFHDVIEIESGDTFNLEHNDENSKEQELKEKESLKKLKNQIPLNMSKYFEKLFFEFEEMKTIESRFCKAIDKLDPVFHNLYGKKIWQKNGFNEKILRNNKEKYFKEFPEIMGIFEQILDYAKENKYW
ncbi:HD domain-containing protein [archaeon]|jgi:putative hydrolases of HD superfamily|nr:HD domain-containing protein [archaeon]MBT3451568.1 HD domain-containing protein [archaeon]MBT6869427.1 HD domain-containing protein [archaeon]MBT7192590.1 HD domain-containing protein [archaeon]MBT7380666.1 HD domain-containing protein [archaeon]